MQSIRNTAIIFFETLLTCCLYAQKPSIDSSCFDKWPSVGRETISNDGRYISYATSTRGSEHEDVLISSIDKQWQRKFSNAGIVTITQDSRWASFQRNDTIFTIKLGGSEIRYTVGLKGNYTLLRRPNDRDIYLYKLKANPGILYAKNTDEEVYSYPSVERYWYNAKSGNLLILEKDNSQPGSYHLKKTNAILEKPVEIWTGPDVETLVFNNDGTESAFITSNDQNKQALWYTWLQKEAVINLIKEDSPVITTDFKMTGIFGISKSSTKVYLTLTKVNNGKYVPAPGVDIYGYKDSKLQSQQLIGLARPPYHLFRAVVDISDGHFLRLDQEDEEIKDLNPAYLPDNKILVIKKGPGDIANEWFWNKSAFVSVYLLSLNDSSRMLLGKDMQHIHAISRYYLSPDEEHVVFFDRDKLDYYSLNIVTGVKKNITGQIQAKWVRAEDGDTYPGNKNSVFGIGGYTNDGAVLIYDAYDIYKVDLQAKVPSINLTASFGKAHQIRFRIISNNRGTDDLNKCYDIKESALVEAWDDKTKNQGCGSIMLNRVNRMDSIALLPMHRVGRLTKARDANIYLTTLEDEKSPPNIFLSPDLRKFTSFSDVHPELKYNWLTAELVTWQLPDSRSSQGILYKPENFDSHNKYPLIFLYYEQRSEALHNFLTPGFTYGEIDIPYFVSNGYLVFVPDIHYTLGIPGRSALNAVVSAANVLAKRPYVDATKMGLDGQSFGGFETNYIITHTTRFAAALSTSGMSDLISLYGSLILGNGASRAHQFEVDHDRIGGSLWEFPEKYIENSPVLRADKITTPVMIMANIYDGDVTRAQGVELFTALRRLGKKSWMLQYDPEVGGGHGLYGISPKDFTIRVFQFFNHYLKDAPPPKWMTEGVPASQKGLFTGLELDTSGKRP